MNGNDMKALAKVRYDRAVELIAEAEKLLADNSYKSANNRAYYSAEKALKAVLAVNGKDSDSHNGVIRTFNKDFIHEPNKYFNREDLSIVQSMERVRTASDYDDFYVTSKSECEEQVKKAKILLAKVKNYLSDEGIIVS